ncbi:MAG: N-6 DNA methylase [Chryseolinea sp.]
MIKRNISLTIRKSISIRDSFKISEILSGNDPIKCILSGQVMVRAWAESLPQATRLMYVQSFMHVFVHSYWKLVHNATGLQPKLPNNRPSIPTLTLDESVQAVAVAMATACSKIDIIDASFYIGNAYTSMLPESTRTLQGIFYTPPSLTRRLIDLASKAGVDWSTAKVVDPACGGGAFLAPVCLKIVDSLKSRSADEIIIHIREHLIGFEIDPFAAWLTQVFVEVAIRDIQNRASQRIGSIVKVCDSLKQVTDFKNQFDLVIGNPPYGKVKLEKQSRIAYSESLYGHANYYGLFTHLATELITRRGVIAWLTPTSYLSGEYFKKLRALLGRKVTLIETDFVSHRKGVFENVLQEIVLATYRAPSANLPICVNQVTPAGGQHLDIVPIGKFSIHRINSAPWLLPRTIEQATFVKAMGEMKATIKDWGYHVSTGPLVWNRHKNQLSDAVSAKNDSYPIIWSESITFKGEFKLKAEKKNHKSFFTPRRKDDWLISASQCILLQRTTAKEQDKRLIAAVLPKQTLKKYGGVVVENHLNMIYPFSDSPAVDMELLSRFLNSKAANSAFKSMSGSVAISAYEIESFPLPAADRLNELRVLINQGVGDIEFEEACLRIYLNFK